MIPAKKRFQVLQRDNFRCQYCGKNGKDVSLEVDHMIPKSKGGTDEFDNLITCCRECNIGKGDEIVGVSVNIGKLKLSEHENRTIRWFFDRWNELGNGSINKKNLSFISGFIKLYYSRFTKDYLPMVVRDEKITNSEFEEGEEKCEKILNEFDEFIRDDIRYILDNLESGNKDYETYRTRDTNDYNERLNWLITYQMVWGNYPKPFIYKYSLCPYKIEEWENEMTEQLGY